MHLNQSCLKIGRCARGFLTEVKIEAKTEGKTEASGVETEVRPTEASVNRTEASECVEAASRPWQFITSRPRLRDKGY